MDGTNKVYQQQTMLSDPSYAVGGNSAFTDQKVEAKVKLVSFSDDAYIYLATRFVSDRTYVVLEFRADGSLKIRSRVEGSTTDIITFKTNMPLVMNTWYTIGLSAAGPAGSSTFAAFLNGARVAMGTGAGSAGGGIMLGVRDAVASFDDVVITPP
jgi:hypothetical protein